VPIIKSSADVWDFKQPRHEVICLAFLDGLRVVFDFILILYMRDLAETLVPDKNRKSPLTTDPTLILRLCQDLPLSASLD
jgi:hypothetical protein